MDKKKTLVIGASTNPERYSYLAINKLLAHQHPVAALGNKKGIVNNIEIATEPLPLNDIDTVTLYINPSLQRQYYTYIIGLHPKRIIFNPGTENDELANLASQKGIATLDACTLVLLSTGQY
jgi:predicted CoA-binding protein